MDNIVTEGSQVLQLDDSVEATTNIPINEDRLFVAKVVSYDQGKLVLEKVWDKAETKKQFIAIAKVIGDKQEVPNDIEVNSFVPVSRVGIGNNNFEGSPLSFQLHEETNTERPSFIVLIPPNKIVEVPELPPQGTGTGTTITIDFGEELGIKILDSKVVFDAAGFFVTHNGRAHFFLVSAPDFQCFYDDASSSWWTHTFVNGEGNFWKRQGPDTISPSGTYKRIFGTQGDETITVPPPALPCHVTVDNVLPEQFVLVLRDVTGGNKQEFKGFGLLDFFPFSPPPGVFFYSVFSEGLYTAQKDGNIEDGYSGSYEKVEGTGAFAGTGNAFMTEIS